MTQAKDRAWTILFVAWLVASASLLGSVFFSEVMHFPPCKLCWYQRICLFPLVPILLAGLISFTPTVVRFALPLTLIGWVISVYHNLLYLGVIEAPLIPCGKGQSCTDVQLNVLGFVTIPLLSFLAFTVLAILLMLFYRRVSH